MPLQIQRKNDYCKEISRLFRSPTLETVLMVEKTIKRYSGEFNRRKIWQKLPRKVMWQTYVKILDYLQSINKIAISKKGILVYIWNPKLAKKFMKLGRRKL
ncbi:MAG: hypothetical protein IB618_02925 [Candidatus Pacearchaeota archaeon]|nr:MAG: hypothetical protein IB618_02925 [Candidatus Pacearchaeota archaeon]